MNYCRLHIHIKSIYLHIKIQILSYGLRKGYIPSTMDKDSQLKETLHIAVNNAVSRMEALKKPSDRRCLFQEYKEWLGGDINDEVWAIPTEAIQNDNG